MKTRIFHLLLKVLLLGKHIQAYPQLNALNSDVSSISTPGATDSDLSSISASDANDSDLSSIPTSDPVDSDISSILTSDPTDSEISSIPTSNPANSDISSIPTPDPTDSDISSISVSAPTSVENQNICETSTEKIDSSLPESENLSSQNDSSGSISSNVFDINKRLVDNTKDSEQSSSKACPAPNYQQNHPPTSPTKAKPIKNGSDDDCRIDPKTKRCEVAIATLVYTRTCKATSDNDLVTLELIKMVGSTAGVYLSKIKGCGVFFWYAKLKPSQVARLVKFKAVRGIAPDGKIDHYDVTLGKKVSATEAAQINSKHRLRKRDTVVTRPNRAGDLAHISSAPGRRNDHKTYRYFRSAGQATIGGRQQRAVAYVLGEGVNERNSDIRPSSINWWIYGLGVARRESIEAENRHITTCLISKIVGVTNGVASQADVVMVKVLNKISSFIDGLVQIISDVRSQSHDTAGFAVVSISHSWRQASTSEINTYAMKRLLKILESLGIVIVCASGKNDQFPEGEENDPAHRQVRSYPALWSQDPDMSIIAVGSIHQSNEQTPYWSPVGDAITVSAPGFCVCATGDPGYETVEALGSNISASIVTGLLLAFAALGDVGPKLRAYQNIPRAFKAYLIRKAYVRRGGTALSVWNGLSAEISDQWIADTDNLVENDAPPNGGAL